MLKVIKYHGFTAETDNNLLPWFLTGFLLVTVTKIKETKNTQFKKFTFKELFRVTVYNYAAWENRSWKH